ncbi:hypothetical protein V6x_56700 [Gimesia chilikensis]|uniref:AAA family ATPase n=1 Tax=Gimesia chilikensis TaxID=2605989 RepID=A0A517WKY8_9PLAN|nr:hypothetical protein [Gimesia chilikensis]QDU05926.1 hypothetical protein V6x_56700 [Gimesia chilikensis]
MNQMTLSGEQQIHLQSFQAKLTLIGDRVRSVAGLYHTGCYLVGRPGTSKSYTVKGQLNQIGVAWVYKNARMTPMGLFSFIAEHPDQILVLDDIGSLFKSEQALQILLSALDGDPQKARVVTYKSKDEDLRVQFTGGIIALSNFPLRSDPLAKALGSRVVLVEHEPTDEEIAAYIHQLALKGADGLTVEECIEVSGFLITETRDADLRLDLRQYDKAVRDYRQYKNGHSQTPWHDLVRTSLMRLATESNEPISKKEEIENQRQLVRQAIQQFPDDTHAQLSATGLKKSTFYSRRKEVLAEA